MHGLLSSTKLRYYDLQLSHVHPTMHCILTVVQIIIVIVQVQFASRIHAMLVFVRNTLNTHELYKCVYGIKVFPENNLASLL